MAVIPWPIYPFSCSAHHSLWDAQGFEPSVEGWCVTGWWHRQFSEAQDVPVFLPFRSYLPLSFHGFPSRNHELSQSPKNFCCVITTLWLSLPLTLTCVLDIVRKNNLHHVLGFFSQSSTNHLAGMSNLPPLRVTTALLRSYVIEEAGATSLVCYLEYGQHNWGFSPYHIMC